MCIAAQNFVFIYLNVCNCIYLSIYLFEFISVSEEYETFVDIY